MVLDCCWSPDGKFFATASRDKTVKLWQKNPNNEWTATTTTKFAESVTAIEMTISSEGSLLAVGMESGAISLHTVVSETLEVKLVYEIEARYDPSLRSSPRPWLIPQGRTLLHHQSTCFQAEERRSHACEL